MKFQNKAYRDAFADSQLQASIAAQITTIREDRGWTQEELANKAGMLQPRISLLEDPNYKNATISTLKRMASGLDVALVVRFVPFSDLLRWANNSSPENFNVPSFENDHPPEIETNLKVIPEHKNTLVEADWAANEWKAGGMLASMSFNPLRGITSNSLGQR